MEKWNRWQDWATVVLGVILFITPFAAIVSAYGLKRVLSWRR